MRRNRDSASEIGGREEREQRDRAAAKKLLLLLYLSQKFRYAQASYSIYTFKNVDFVCILYFRADCSLYDCCCRLRYIHTSTRGIE